MVFKRTIFAASLLAAVSVVQAAPSNEEIWALLQEMQGQLADLQQQNQQLRSENETLKGKVEETAIVASEASEAAEAVFVATEEAARSGGMASGRTSVGGYGEVHYNNLEDQHGIADLDQADFHRFVLFFGHDFNDRLRFFSEFELEHAFFEVGEGPGEIELEQGYVQYDINDHQRVSGGMFLIPVGIINETHEPPTFYGVERNLVEKNIVPTTWWEGGAMLSGEFGDGFSYDLAATTGLKTSAGDNFKVRAHQKLAKALAEDFAYTGRLKWTGMPGVELAATLHYQEDITQSLEPTGGSATLFETHAVIDRGGFGLRALYAVWDLDGSGPKAVGADEQSGWYIEPSYRINEKVGVFARFSEWDNQAGDSVDSEFQQFDLGLNWWLHEDVVVKFDYQSQSTPANKKELDGFNVGIGYQF